MQGLFRETSNLQQLQLIASPEAYWSLVSCEGENFKNTAMKNKMRREKSFWFQKQP